MDEAILLKHGHHVHQASALSSKPDRPRTNNAPQIAFKVDGEVQGVNFRSSAQKQAKSIGVTGWVSNASDGTVRRGQSLLHCSAHAI